MPNQSPAAIANAFVDLAGGPLPQMKLQKLAYIAHGWSLAVLGVPLIDGRPEAWDNGPVFRSIWNRIRDFGLRQGKVKDYDGSTPTAQLSAQEQAILQHVWAKYGGYSALQLSDLTHQPNTPWSRAYYSQGRNAPIPNDEIQRHYLALAQAGRALA